MEIREDEDLPGQQTAWTEVEAENLKVWARAVDQKLTATYAWYCFPHVLYHFTFTILPGIKWFI